MGAVGTIAAEMRYVGWGFVAALLPQPESANLGRSRGVDVATYSLGLGLIEATVGGLGFLFGAIGAMTGSVPIFNRLLLENWFPEMTTTHFMGGGLVSLLVWCTHPLAWLLALFGLTGLVRIVAFSTSRQAVGEPLVWIALRVSTTALRWIGRFFETRSLGPLRPDRFVRGGDGGMTVLACRARDDWTDGIVMDFEGRFFRLVGVEDRVEGAFRVKAYAFSELEEHEVIRHPQPYVTTPDRCS